MKKIAFLTADANYANYLQRNLQNSRISAMINQNSPEYEKETVILAQIDLTTGSIPKTLLRFAFPMICGNAAALCVPHDLREPAAAAL